MDVNKILDELQDLVEKQPLPLIRRTRPMRYAFFLNVDDVLDQIEQIRAALPQQIQKADQITRDKENIIAEAREQAHRMITEAAEQAELTIRKAQDEARILVSSHEITRLSQQEGQRIVEQARQEAAEIRQGALEYARQMMDSLGQSVENLSQHVSRLQQAASKARDDIKA